MVLRSVLSSASGLRLPHVVAAPKRWFSHTLTPQQEEVQNQCRNFALEHLKPNAAQCDRDGTFPHEHIQKLANMGLMGVTVSPDHGGSGHDMLSLAVAVEEISRGCASTGMILAIHNALYTNLVDQKGTERQKEVFLNDYTKGDIGCFALSEPEAGTDVASIQTIATKDGDDWILNGDKHWVTNCFESRSAAVFATVDPALKHKGLACFLVPLETAGVFRGKKEGILGVRAATISTMKLDEARIPGWCQVGGVGDGFKIAMAQLDQARIAIAAHALGIAQSALDTALSYAASRTVFGKPLNKFTSVQDRLADMSIQIESTRLLTYRAATEISTKNSAMAKYVASRAAVSVTDHCVQILGGKGISTQYPAERHYRDARGTQIYGGVTDVQKMLIGLHLLRDYRNNDPSQRTQQQKVANTE